MRIEELTTKEFARLVKKDPIVFLPIGATEAHGMHLPLGTDSYQPQWLCDALAQKLGGLVAPLLPYGQHSSTRNMPGTIALRSETLRALVTDVIDSLVRQGVRKLVIISGHAGSVHMAAVREAAETASVRYGQLKLMFLTDYDIAYKFPLPDSNYRDGHGGMIETSRILALRPELVGKKRPRGRFEDKRFMIVANPEVCYPEGMVGDATKATADLGNKINEFIFEEMVHLIKLNFEV
ncbi:MAG: creatininase family protein [Methanomassiliicoccales archaeon]|nr:creatininase family protein [Methanomassiliicoccales archaeon]